MVFSQCILKLTLNTYTEKGAGQGWDLQLWFTSHSFEQKYDLYTHLNPTTKCCQWDCCRHLWFVDSEIKLSFLQGVEYPDFMIRLFFNQHVVILFLFSMLMLKIRLKDTYNIKICIGDHNQIKICWCPLEQIQ